MSASDDSAHAAWDAGDLRAAFLQFRAMATEGRYVAMQDLGYFHDEGLGTPRSKHDAMHWYAKASRLGSGGATSNIAILYRERLNHRKMYRWFLLSAKQGDGDSMVDVASCHRDGLGTPRWPGRAIGQARKAARSTHITAAGRDEAKEILRALRFASSSTRITGVRDRRRSTSLASDTRPTLPRHDNLEEFTDPANYDLEQGPRSQARIAFWCRMAQQFGGPVLELGCGTGLVAIPVAAMGLSVTGVDLVAPMLAHAQAKAERADVEVRWIQADVRELALPRRFGFAILTGNAFQAFLTRADQAALMATVSRHLAPEGVFGFETRNPAGHDLRDEPEGPPEIDYVDVAGRRVLLSSAQAWDDATQVLHWTTWRRWTDDDGTPRERMSRIACRFTRPDEIEDLLEAAGFDIVAQYGDWDFAPFRAHGERLITLCRRRGGG